MKIAVLVACHNRVSTTLSCLRALFESWEQVKSHRDYGSDLTLDLFLVDDGSSDGTGVSVQKWVDSVSLSTDGAFRGRVIYGEGLWYWSKSMAQAWRTAIDYENTALGRFDFFLWLNDDVDLEPMGLVTLLDDTINTKYGVVAGACGIKRDDTWVMTYGAMDLRYRKMCPTGKPECIDGWFTGNVLLVPRAVFKEIGIISSDYSHAYGDIDYAMRLKRRRIPFYASSNYVGVCAYGPVNKIKEWPLLRRLPFLFTPSMWNLRDIWIFQNKYYNPFRAVAYCLHRIYIVLRG